jgi:hypothetical protein
MKREGSQATVSRARLRRAAGQATKIKKVFNLEELQ